MVEARSGSIRCQTQLSSGRHLATSDTTRDKGGSESGFRPHDLLEAALASCINITLRMYADEHSLPLSGVTARVKLDRKPEETVFEYKVDLEGKLTEGDRLRLIEVAKRCPVRKTLEKQIRFRDGRG